MARLRDSWPLTLIASTQKWNPSCPSHLLGNRITPPSCRSCSAHTERPPRGGLSEIRTSVLIRWYIILQVVFFFAILFRCLFLRADANHLCDLRANCDGANHLCDLRASCYGANH